VAQKDITNRVGNMIVYSQTGPSVVVTGSSVVVGAVVGSGVAGAVPGVVVRKAETPEKDNYTS
jgi:hypothetical protein